MDKKSVKFDFNLSGKERNEFFVSRIPNGLKEVDKSKHFEKILNSFDLEHLYKNQMNKNNSIEKIFDNFHDQWTKKIYDKLDNPKTSIFSETNATFFASVSAMTRSLNTELGYIWEDIACLSDKVISPEKTFGNYKVKGVDIIIKDNKNLVFTQIKTNKDTLTASQEPRTRIELGAFNNSMFAAAHNINRWHFKDYPDIPRIAGEEFWNMIEIDYSDIVENLKNLFGKLEPLMLSYFLDKQDG